MARLAATAVLLLSLLAVASCRFIDAEPETVVAISDEQSQADPSAIPQENDAAEAVPSLPTVTAVEGILRIPSHRRPCPHGFLQRHLRWARNHGLSHRRGAFAGPGDARVDVPAFLPEEPAREAEVEVVAEPDPDSRPDTDVEVEEKYSKPPRGDGNGGEENELVKAWKGEMARRFHAHSLRFHNGHHHHEHAVEVEKDDSEHQEEQVKEEGAGDVQLQQRVKLFSRHFHHHNHGDEEQDETASKHYFHHHHHDSDNEVDEVEELARRLSKAIMRRSSRRGGIGHHHHHHAEEGSVKKWFRGFMNMNRF